MLEMLAIFVELFRTLNFVTSSSKLIYYMSFFNEAQLILAFYSRKIVCGIDGSYYVDCMSG